MGPGPAINADEILLRRVRPPLDERCKALSDGSRRPNSDVMACRSDEVALSCSRLRLTSPRQLLDQLRQMSDPIDPKGWGVCWFRFSDVVQIADGEDGHLEVWIEPTQIDLGHCGIYASNGRPCPNTRSARRKLALIARLLSDEQIKLLQAGDTIEG